jgi:CRISPR-associated endonuclease/helicase Cas3
MSLNLTETDIASLGAALGLTHSDSPFFWQQELLVRFLAGDIPSALDIPTGLGKTAVIAIWLIALANKSNIPRRLVYIVDRRVVVDQATEVANRVRDFVENRPDIKAALGLTNNLPISTLRGQHLDNREWLQDPATPAIIVGTIDMIGSRLLFEGYGISRKMRPFHAALLGVDTLIVLDEAHLVPPFEQLLKTIVQPSNPFSPVRPEHQAIIPLTHILSLSATGRTDENPFCIGEEDLQPGTITHKRLTAVKRLIFKTHPDDQPLAEALAECAMELATGDPKKIIVFSDKRDDAVKAKEKLDKDYKKIGQPQIDCELLTGGRRVKERDRTAQWLEEHSFLAGSNTPLKQPAVVFATSAGEVGIDLDADHMVCDLVTWERMIQRLGRVNRRGNGNAKITVIREQKLEPNKAVQNAFKIEEHNRSKKEIKTIEDYISTTTKSETLAEPFKLLPKIGEEIDVSPAALRDLKLSTQPNSQDPLNPKQRKAILEAATSSSPLHPELSRPLADAWSMTSLEEHAGRPKIQPWLRGWIDEEPQTTVVWRKYLPFRKSTNANHEFFENERILKNDIEGFFEVAAPHLSEMLETETGEVFTWFKKCLSRIHKQNAKNKTAPENYSPSAIILNKENKLLAVIKNKNGDLKMASFKKNNTPLAQEENHEPDKKIDELIKNLLKDAILIVDSGFGGLNKDGFLDDSFSEKPSTLDNGEIWSLGNDGVAFEPFRIRLTPLKTSSSSWRQVFNIPFNSSNDEPNEGIFVEQKFNTETGTRYKPRQDQLLTKHLQLANMKARELSQRLCLSHEYGKMLEIAARLHDEGKKFEIWQNAFNAPTENRPYAKTKGPINLTLLAGFRHELASLEDLLEDNEFKVLDSDLQDLCMHLVAAHHGFARPNISITGYPSLPPSVLENRAQDIAMRFSRLQRQWGPWGLAWWEAILRSVDQQASQVSDDASLNTEPSSGKDSNL